VQLERIMEEMEGMAIDLRDEVEKQYARRCALSGASCREAAYDGCVTSYTDQASCETDYVKIAECNSCGSVFDFTTSNVRIPQAYMSDGPGSRPDTPSLKETVCFTNAISPFMKEQADAVRDGDTFNEIPQTYFGAHNGLFRYYPARQTGVCGSYDPRVRPWFTAASSGPKDVILVLDVSGSMNIQGRWNLAKAAAVAVLNSLSIADHFGVVLFSTGARTLSGEFSTTEGQPRMLLATEENIGRAIGAIKSVDLGGSTNFQAAFEKTFEMLDVSFREESSSRCHSAILFLTDGEMTYPEQLDPQVVYDLVVDRNAAHGATLFTYSLGSSADRTIPKRLACSTGGVWSAIPDGDDLASYMSAYYKLFAIGLGGPENRDFVAWVEPYLYESGEDYGTTVSAPVYDRTVSPPIWLGVVGIDFTVGAMTRVVGGSDAYSVVLKRLVDKSVARCPLLDASDLPCLIESLRKETGTESACGSEDCPVGLRTEPETCGGDEFYPMEFWANKDFKVSGFHAIKSYSERTCCNADRATSWEVGGGAGSCSAGDGAPSWLTFVIPIIIVIASVVIICALWTKKRQKSLHMAQSAPPSFHPELYSGSVPSAPAMEMARVHIAQPVIVGGPPTMAPVGATYATAPPSAAPPVAVPVAVAAEAGTSYHPTPPPAKEGY